MPLFYLPRINCKTDLYRSSAFLSRNEKLAFITI